MKGVGNAATGRAGGGLGALLQARERSVLS